MTSSGTIERRLLEERDRALRALHQAESEETEPQPVSAGDVSRFHQHPADSGAATAESEKDFMIASRESDRLADIDEALRTLRADPDGYSRCERCGGPIGTERLEILPWARLCGACARRGGR